MSDANEVVILDDSQERALINILPKGFKKRVEQLYQKHPEYLGMSEDELFEFVRPTSTLDFARVAFWSEYDRAQAAGVRMVLENVIGRGISRASFYDTYLNNHKYFAWILCPIEEHMRALKVGVDRAQRVMVRMLSSDVFDSEGKIDPKRAGVFLKAYELAANRLFGASVQRVIQANHNITSNAVMDDRQKQIDKLMEVNAPALIEPPVQVEPAPVAEPVQDSMERVEKALGFDFTVTDKEFKKLLKN